MSQANAEIVLISPRGMLGRAFAAELRGRDIPFEIAARPSFDVTRPQDIARGLGAHVRCVINCSAYTDVDGAETHEAEAHAVNAQAVQLLAQRCKELGALLVHFSTDYVFNGCSTTPYRTTDQREPQNAYGRSKARGEELLEAAGCEYLLIRTSWLYAPWGKNFVDTIARFGRERPRLRVVDDQRGRPTSAQYLAQRSLALIDRQARGIFHVTDGGECTWYDFAREIVVASGGGAVVDPCTYAEYQRPAPRPAYSVLDLTRTEALLGTSSPWQSNLADVLRERASTNAIG